MSEAEARSKEIIREARERAAQIVDQASKRSNEMIEEAKGTASSEAQRLIAGAHEEVALETTRARESCGAKSASSRSKARRACSGARSIRRLTRICSTSSRPRSRVAERATIARPYAKAAFEYARDARAFAPWSPASTSPPRSSVDPRVTALIKNPELPAADIAEFIIGVAGDKLDARMQNFVRVLAENHRLLLLPEILAHYEVCARRSRTPWMSR